MIRWLEMLIGKRPTCKRRVDMAMDELKQAALNLQTAMQRPVGEPVPAAVPVSLKKKARQ